MRSRVQYTCLILVTLVITYGNGSWTDIDLDDHDIEHHHSPANRDDDIASRIGLMSDAPHQRITQHDTHDSLLAETSSAVLEDSLMASPIGGHAQLTGTDFSPFYERKTFPNPRTGRVEHRDDNDSHWITAEPTTTVSGKTQLSSRELFSEMQKSTNHAPNAQEYVNIIPPLVADTSPPKPTTHTQLTPIEIFSPYDEQLTPRELSRPFERRTLANHMIDVGQHTKTTSTNRHHQRLHNWDTVIGVPKLATSDHLTPPDTQAIGAQHLVFPKPITHSINKLPYPHALHDTSKSNAGVYSKTSVTTPEEYGKCANTRLNLAHNAGSSSRKSLNRRINEYHPYRKTLHHTPMGTAGEYSERSAMSSGNYGACPNTHLNLLHNAAGSTTRIESTSKNVQNDACSTREPCYQLLMFIVDLLKLGTMKAIIEKMCTNHGDIHTFRITNLEMFKKACGFAKTYCIPYDLNNQLQRLLAIGCIFRNDKSEDTYSLNLDASSVYKYVESPDFGSLFANNIVRGLYKLGAGVAPPQISLWRLVVDLLREKPTFDAIVKNAYGSNIVIGTFIVESPQLLDAAWSRVSGKIYRVSDSVNELNKLERERILFVLSSGKHAKTVYIFNKEKILVDEYIDLRSNKRRAFTTEMLGSLTTMVNNAEKLKHRPLCHD